VVGSSLCLAEPSKGKALLTSKKGVGTPLEHLLRCRHQPLVNAA
jgi:hypothetical protein